MIEDEDKISLRMVSKVNEVCEGIRNPKDEGEYYKSLHGIDNILEDIKKLKDIYMLNTKNR